MIVRPRDLRATPPWELPPETGAFVQVLVAERSSPGADPRWLRAFSGWLFKNSPSLNVVEHPIYDVWVKDCAMSFPGEEAPCRPHAIRAPAFRCRAFAQPDAFGLGQQPGIGCAVSRPLGPAAIASASSSR